MSGHDVLGFPRTPILIKKIFGGTGFQPVPAQAKACGYILSIHPLNTEYKIPAGHYCLNHPLKKGGLRWVPMIYQGVITRSIKEITSARFEGTARRAPTVQKGQLVFRSE
jgi:hypothetical protein